MTITTQHPSGIVAEIPEPVRSQIQALRDSLNTRTARLPVEMTLAGSSGVGMIPVGTELSVIERNLDRVLQQSPAFPVRFSAIRAFPGAATIYLEPADPSPFARIHRLLCTSSIPFAKIPWPYTPHCTLRCGEPLNDEEMSEILCHSFPREEFWISTVSVYHLDDSWLACELLCQRTLQEASPSLSIELSQKQPS